MAEVRCPKCRSTDFTVLGNTGKSLSLGKGIIGGALFGPIGAAGGAILGTKGKYDIVCNKCGNRWQVKR